MKEYLKSDKHYSIGVSPDHSLREAIQLTNLNGSQTAWGVNTQCTKLRVHFRTRSTGKLIRVAIYRECYSVKLYNSSSRPEYPIGDIRGRCSPRNEVDGAHELACFLPHGILRLNYALSGAAQCRVKIVISHVVLFTHYHSRIQDPLDFNLHLPPSSREESGYAMEQLDALRQASPVCH